MFRPSTARFPAELRQVDHAHASAPRRCRVSAIPQSRQFSGPVSGVRRRGGDWICGKFHESLGFPRLNGLTTSLGPSNANSYYDGTFTAPANLTWVHRNHTFKLGAEFRLNSWTDRNSRGAQGILNFSANETGDPFNNTNSFSANGVSGCRQRLRQFFFWARSTVRLSTPCRIHNSAGRRGDLYSGHLEGNVKTDSGLRTALGYRRLGP